MKLGQIVRHRREQLNLSRESLAKAVGVETYVLRDAELKDTTPKNLCDILPKLASALNCSVGELLGVQLSQSDITKVAEDLHRLSGQLLHLLKNGGGHE